MQPTSERITVTLDVEDLADWLSLKGLRPDQEAHISEDIVADMYRLPDGRAAIAYRIDEVSGGAVVQNASGLDLKAWLRLRIAKTSGNP